MKAGTILSVAFSVTVSLQAATLKLVDIEYTHTGWYKHFGNTTGVADWTKPINYSKGNFYMRLEVKRFTAKEYPTMFQPCIFGGSISSDHHACTGDRSSGVYTFSKPETRIYSRNIGGFWCSTCPVWTKVVDFMLIDNYGNDKGIDRGQGKPTLRVEAYVTGPGETFVPPAHWGVKSIAECSKFCSGASTLVLTGATKPTPVRMIGVHADMRFMRIEIPPLSPYEVSVRNLRGAVVLKRDGLSSSRSSVSFPHHLRAGTYAVDVMTTRRVVTSRIVIR